VNAWRCADSGIRGAPPCVDASDGRDFVLGAESDEDRSRAGSSLIAYPARAEMVKSMTAVEFERYLKRVVGLAASPTDGRALSLRSGVSG
jgi:hypothetical protein